MTKPAILKTSAIIGLFLFPLISNGQIVIRMQKSNGVYTVPCKVNGRSLRFIFDTGASDVSLSLEEAIKMVNLGLVSKDDFLGTKYYQDATGGITEGIKVNIKLLEIDKIILRNVEATILKTLNAPLLLGQSAFSKIGRIEFDPQKETFTILNKSLINESKTYDLFRDVILNQTGLIDNFCGFKLLQYESCIQAQLGEPNLTKEITNDEKYVVYTLAKDEDANLIFHLLKLPESSDLKQLTAVQLTGRKSTFSIRGIKLGNPVSLIYENFGTPSHITDIENDYGKARLLDFDNLNISFETNNGIVSSINVFYGNITAETKYNNEQLFNFKMFKNALNTFSVEELMYLFMPDFEISSSKKKNIYFTNGFAADLSSNKDLIQFISDKTYGLKSLLNPSIKAENNIRIKKYTQDKIGFLFVLKIKNSQSINEIVLKPYFGRLLIWEIN